MLDIYIRENDRDMSEQLKELCLGYLIKKNYDAEIYTFSEEINIENAALYMLMLDDETEAISRKIHTLGSNYIVVLLSSMAELKKAVKPGISPSGFIVKPWEREDVEAALDEIYADHIRCGQDAPKLGIFTFRQKAKEFSIPYERIILFESRNKKVIVRTEVQEFEFYDTLDSVLKTAPDCFMKIHKSFVVNLSRIVSADYGTMTVEFDDGSAAYMSRTYKNELREILNGRSVK